MPCLVVRWDHQGLGVIKTREYPIDTLLKVKPSEMGYSSLMRMDRGVWTPELTTPGEIFIQGSVV
jgi:hypothetical protein